MTDDPDGRTPTSARDAVLAAIRGALGEARGRAAPVVSRGYRDAGVAADPVSLFVERVEDYRATVSRCRAEDVDRLVAEALNGRSAVVPPSLPWTIPGAVTDDGLTVEQLDRVSAVVTQAALGIAETGTIVLDHQAGQGRRVLSLLPDLHVCVLYADQIVAAVPAAIAALDPARPQTWISGPSATSDIELNRVEGVHGPRTLHVVLVEGSPPPTT